MGNPQDFPFAFEKDTHSFPYDGEAVYEGWKSFPGSESYPCLLKIFEMESGWNWEKF